MPAATRKISYTPPHTLANFHGSDKFIRGIMGPYGSGKSVGMCMEILAKARAQRRGPDGIRRSRWAIIRNSYGELRSTTQATWADWFPTDVFGPIRRGSGPDVHMVRLPQEKMELEVLFLALDRDDDARKVLSLELTGAWLNEAREIPWKAVEALMARVGRYPSKRDGGPSWSGIIMDTNPPNTRSWWYQRFEVERPENWAVFKQPSGMSPEAENKDNLPEMYYENMMSGMDELSIRCHVHGEYAFMRSGCPVFPQFQHSLHVAKQPLNVRPKEPIIAGIDVGRSPGVLFGQESYGGQLRILSELTAEDTSAIRLVEMIKRHVQVHYPDNQVNYFADPAFTQRSQTRDESVADVFYNGGLVVQGAGTNSLEIRLEAVRTLLGQLDPAGQPMLLVDPRCERLIEALVGGYHYKTEPLGGERYVEVPVKDVHSHIADTLQYLVLGSGNDPRYTQSKVQHRPPRVLGVAARSHQPMRMR